MEYEELKQKIVECITDNVEDVNEERRVKGLKWVYSDLPKPDVSTYPRVGVEVLSEETSWFSLGGTKLKKNINVTIMVFVDRKRKVNYNGNVLNYQQILNHLVEQVKKTLLDKNNIINYFVGLGVYGVIPTSDKLVENNEVVVRTTGFSFLVGDNL